MSNTNIFIREKAQKRGVLLWQIADALGVTDGNLSRKLRHELGAEERDRILSIIDRIADNREVNR